jgi:hypothetical protein
LHSHAVQVLSPPDLALPSRRVSGGPVQSMNDASA